MISLDISISAEVIYNALFKQELNTSPQQFLTNAKIANARELLSKTKIPIYSVALSCGYKNAFAFSRAFKQVTNISPRRISSTLSPTKRFSKILNHSTIAKKV